MKLSVITINYNNIEGLRSTIHSVLNQTAFNEIEYVIVDGHSNDGSLGVIQSFDCSISKWVSETDTGIYNAMNKGVMLSSGDYCLFLNSGDCFHDSTVIADMLTKLDGSDIIIGRVLYLNTGLLSDISEPLTMNRFYKSSVPHPASFIKRSLLLKCPYDESYRIVSDWKFFIQTLILQNASFSFIDRIITDYDSTGISSTNKALVERERKNVYAELIPARILLDYIQFNDGQGYQNTDYDRFFIKLRNYRYSRFIYFIDVLLMRVVAIFRNGADFVKDYPLLKK